jgi:hypothetical protein
LDEVEHEHEKGRLLKGNPREMRKTWSGEKTFLSHVKERKGKEREKGGPNIKKTAFFYSKFSSSISSSPQSTLFITPPPLFDPQIAN